VYQQHQEKENVVSLILFDAYGAHFFYKIPKNDIFSYGLLMGLLFMMCNILLIAFPIFWELKVSDNGEMRLADAAVAVLCLWQLFVYVWLSILLWNSRETGQLYGGLDSLSDWFEAALNGSLGETKRMLEINPDWLNCKDSCSKKPHCSNSTALHYAAWRGDSACVNFLVSEGSHLNAKDDLGHTPLHSAAKGKKWGVVELLTNLGATDIADNEGNTVLVKAIQAKKTETASLLAKKYTDSRTQYPLHWSKCPENSPFVLVDVKADSKEYAEVSHHFKLTCSSPQHNIKSISRVENETLFAEYLLNRSKLVKEL